MQPKYCWKSALSSYFLKISVVWKIAQKPVASFDQDLVMTIVWIKKSACGIYCQ
jgi:hypothetical protein